MRIVARFTDDSLAGEIMERLGRMGFDENDVAVSDLGEVKNTSRNVAVDAQAGFDGGHIEVVNLRPAFEELGNELSYMNGAKKIKGKEGIIVSVKTPKSVSDSVMEFMKRSGAVEIARQ